MKIIILAAGSPLSPPWVTQHTHIPLPPKSSFALFGDITQRLLSNFVQSYSLLNCEYWLPMLPMSSGSSEVRMQVYLIAYIKFSASSSFSKLRVRCITLSHSNSESFERSMTSHAVRQHVSTLVVYYRRKRRLPLPTVSRIFGGESIVHTRYTFFTFHHPSKSFCIKNTKTKKEVLSPRRALCFF